MKTLQHKRNPDQLKEIRIQINGDGYYIQEMETVNHGKTWDEVHYSSSSYYDNHMDARNALESRFNELLTIGFE